MLNLEKDIINGREIDPERFRSLWDAPLESLTACAVRIRERFCGNSFDFCSIINGKSGLCPEDCKYCAQSAKHGAVIDEYPLLDGSVILKAAETTEREGIGRFSVVTSGRRLTEKEAEALCDAVKLVKSRCNISLCLSCGLLTEEMFLKLKKAGAERYHCNLETSRRFFPEICSTHSYEDKISALKAAGKAGFEICSGGIIGLGESLEDRVSMALELKRLGVSSVPLNIFTPVKGTPLGNKPVLPYEEILRTAAVFRFILPAAFIRAAGGRGCLPDKGRAMFGAGVNAAITGGMLTTDGVSAGKDKAVIKELGFDC